MVFPGLIGNPGAMQAEELDNLVQHLAVAKYALEADDKARAAEALDAAMVIGRRLLTREQAENGPLSAESMVRTRPSPSPGRAPATASGSAADHFGLRLGGAGLATAGRVVAGTLAAAAATPR